MHKRKIAHRDIKPENILLEDPMSLRIKLTDFGFATFYNQDNKMNDFLGSPNYLAPEIIEGRKYDEKVDIWAAGCIVYTLLIGKPPFQGASQPEVFSAIRHNQVDYNHETWGNISNEAQNFCHLALNKDPNKRATAQVLLGHLWLNVSDESNSKAKSQIITKMSTTKQLMK